MARTRKRRMMNQINVVPYIDVTLVLLVIFMVTAPMTNPGVVELPKVGQALKQTGAPIVVTVRKDGMAEIEGKKLQRDELLFEIKKQLKKNPRAVVVAADEKNRIWQSDWCYGFAETSPGRQGWPAIQTCAVMVYHQND